MTTPQDSAEQTNTHLAKPVADFERSILILGGGSDIGQAFLRHVAQYENTKIVLAGRSGGSRDKAAEVLRADLDNCTVDVADFDAADIDSHSSIIEQISTTHGGFDTIMVAFGSLGEAFTIDVAPKEVARLFHINASAAASATLASLNVLRGVPDAKLVVISSIAAARPRIGNLAYGAAKAAIDSFAQELARPAAKVGVHILVVRPGFVHTAMTEGLDPAPFATTAPAVAQDIYKALLDNKQMVHSPPILNAVGQVFKNLPKPIWRAISGK